MKEVLLGLLAIASIIYIFYRTGKLINKLVSKYNSDDEIEEEDYLGEGFAFWLIVGVIITFSYGIGSVVLHFI